MAQGRCQTQKPVCPWRRRGRRQRGCHSGIPHLRRSVALLLGSCAATVRSVAPPAVAAAFATTPMMPPPTPMTTAAAATTRRRYLRSLCFNAFAPVRRSTAAAASVDRNEGDGSGNWSGENHACFYDRLGRPRSVLAPMVAQSDLAFRLMCSQQFGVDLCYTQMIHATNFVRDESFRRAHLDVYRTQSNIERGLESQWNNVEGIDEDEMDEIRCRLGLSPSDRIGADCPTGSRPSSAAVVGGPTVVQIAAHDPTVAVEAARLILDRAGSAVAAVDLNLGCPQSIARKGRYGAHLMEEDNGDTACRVLSALRSELPSTVGVTAKIRLPEQQENKNELTERIYRLVDSGIDLLTVHGRTLRENKTAVRRANWDAIRDAVELARFRSGDSSFPVVANGGIETRSDVRRCFEATGASAVMSSEGLLEHPGLFVSACPWTIESDKGGGVDVTDEKEATRYHPRDILERQLGYADLYLDYATVYPPIPGSLGKKGGSFNVVRGHLFKILYRYLEENPDLREKLGRQDTTGVWAARRIVNELRRRYVGVTDGEWSGRPSSDLFGSSWYRRHRGAQERVHRRCSMGERDEGASELSVEERKSAARERIRKLREQREAGQGVVVGGFKLTQSVGLA